MNGTAITNRLQNSFKITCTNHRIFEMLGLRPSNRLPVSYYLIKRKDKRVKLVTTYQSTFICWDIHFILHILHYVNTKMSLRCLSSSKLTCSKVLRISYSDFRFEIGNGGKLRSKLYVKRDDVIFQIVNFPFISSNIPLALAYGVYISQLKHYSSAFCAQSRGFLDICWHKSYPNKDTLVIGWVGMVSVHGV